VTKLPALLLLTAALFLVACGDDDSSSSKPTAKATTAADACSKDNLKTKTPGTLTVATDKPAYPPYFEDDNPANGKGFESAVAYAIAAKLGYAKDEVKWTVVPFNASYAPGPKQFDFDVNQISITPKRQKVVDFSAPYFTAPQALVVPKGSKLTDAKSLADVRASKIGVQVGTTSFDAVKEVIKPDTDPKVFNNSTDVVTALKQGQVDAAVVDLPTALYLTAAEIPSATVVGQFAAPGGDQWGMLLEKDSPLTDCVNEALAKLKSEGGLDQITQQWMGDETAPELN
jgi:polar amino acid transport system substrate-binding protein